MTELEKLHRAKQYIDQLAQGIDPIGGEAMPDDAALCNVRLSRCFFYVSDILRQVIENGGEIRRAGRSTSSLLPFALPASEQAKLEPAGRALMISHFVKRINDLADLSSMRKLKVVAFTGWLLEKGFLQDEIIADQKHKKPTTAGLSLGISAEKREGPRGTYTALLYDEDAQRFLLDHLDEIIARSNGDAEPKDGEA